MPQRAATDLITSKNYVNPYTAKDDPSRFKSLLLILNCSYWELNIKTISFVNMWSQIKANMNNFHPLLVVDRGSGTQLAVAEICFKGAL